MFSASRLLAALCAASALLLTEAQSGASIIAGSPVSAVWPPANATDTALDIFFPDASEIGHPGATPTGDEAFAVQTAPSAPLKEDILPLIAPGGAQVVISDNATTPFDVARSWGNLSPYWSLGGAWGLPNTSEIIPAGCELTQAHLLHRHGARYPTSGGPPAVFASKIQAAANSTGFNATGPLAFLNTWTYELGAEYDLGVAFRVKYGNLLKGFTDLPVFRTTSERTLNFAAGFFGVPTYQTAYHQSIMIEDTGFFSSLAPWNSCPNANNAISSLGSLASANWTAVYLNDTVARLQPFIEGVTLDTATVMQMQMTCAYETEEWKGFEYAYDLSLWYGNGPGNPVTASLGAAWSAELLARLTQTPPTNFTATAMNGTLDGSNITFPLTQPLYVDATHDTVISTITTALNLTTMAAAGPLPVDRVQPNQTYFGNQVVPFGSNLIAQVMSCPTIASNSTTASSSSSYAPAAADSTTQYIRFLLNDGVVPLTGLAHCETPNSDGLCALTNFVQGLAERLAEIDFEFDCFANYSAPVPDLIVDGRMKK
ncbi:phosphoglycerate mutase-like protein [Epithele typhae]|uniref:phosphoglycerate mutase-like protein n=1 Tax=Epithele typhae TaxID=378194 RepID=UPI002008360E|nr:phosphoglycerate mutase-like protein [Epithele typhae]KAH9938972.1 phosphoglycerate mutase-like protein [Epithele typhae]